MYMQRPLRLENMKLFHLLLLLFFIASSTTCLTSGSHSTGFRAHLTRINTAGEFATSLQRLQHAIRRTKPGGTSLGSSSLEYSKLRVTESRIPVQYARGAYVMSIGIGTPTVEFVAIADTGSDLIWTQCKPCQECFSQPDPLFDPKASSTFALLPCSGMQCAVLLVSACNQESTCVYGYSYGDNSATRGLLSTETLTFGSGDSKVTADDITFGCGIDNTGTINDTGASGIVGLGRGPLSLNSQLSLSKFSYCLTSYGDNTTSPLLFGSKADLNSSDNNGLLQSTPLIRNPFIRTYYYISLLGISVGGKRLPIKNGTFELQNTGRGGMIIDSGTTITYLEESAYKLVRDEFVSQMPDFNIIDGAVEELDLCFIFPSSSSEVKVPSLIFHFEGADMKLPKDNYFLSDADKGLMCLAMDGTSNELSIFGNFQQQNFHFLYDIKNEELAFVPTQCNTL